MRSFVALAVVANMALNAAASNCPLTQPVQNAVGALGTPASAQCLGQPQISGTLAALFPGGLPGAGAALSLLSAKPSDILTALSAPPSANTINYVNGVFMKLNPPFNSLTYASAMNPSTNFTALGFVGGYAIVNNASAPLFVQAFIGIAACPPLILAAQTLSQCISVNCTSIVPGYCNNLPATPGWSAPIGQVFSTFSVGILNVCNATATGLQTPLAMGGLTAAGYYTNVALMTPAQVLQSVTTNCTTLFPVNKFDSYVYIPGNTTTTATPTKSSASTYAAGVMAAGSVFAAMLAL